jgi:ABC-type multidrug transport system permease subunit
MSLHKAEIALVWNEGWHFFLRPGVNDRDRLRALAFQMAVSMGVEKPWQIKMLEASFEDSGSSDGFDLSMLARFRMTPLGPSEDRLFADLIPRVIALVVVFMPFLFACQTVVREKETGMLATLLVAPNVGWWSIVAGKILATVFISTANLLVLLLAAIAMFDVPIRTGVWPVFGMQVLAILVSTLFGLAASTLVGTHRQAYFLSAIYAFCLIFLTGLIFPLERAIDTVNSLSHLLPLTFSLGPLTEWMTNGIYGWPFVQEVRWLYLQLITGLGLLVIGVQIARSRL